MKKFTTLTLSAAMLPALALGTVAFAQDGDGAGQGTGQGTGGMQADEQGTDDQGMERAGEHDDELRADDQYDGEQRTDEDWDDEQRAGEDWDDEQRTDEDWDDEQRAGEDWDGDQGAGEQFMSRKPEGALSSDDVIGKTVKLRDSDDEVGRIDDLLIGDDGQIVGAVVTTGGFLGLGGRDVSMGWDQLEHSMEDDDSVFYTDMDEETLKNAPEYERDHN